MMRITSARGPVIHQKFFSKNNNRLWCLRHNTQVEEVSCLKTCQGRQQELHLHQKHKYASRKQWNSKGVVDCAPVNKRQAPKNMVQIFVVPAIVIIALFICCCLMFTFVACESGDETELSCWRRPFTRITDARAKSSTMTALDMKPDDLTTVIDSEQGPIAAHVSPLKEETL